MHGTTVDNEAGIASGWSDCELSPLGIGQSRKLGRIISDRKFDAVFCSDLKRAVDSAKLMFGKTVPIIKDRRLRECDYGDLTGIKSNKVDSLILRFVGIPFPNGESCKDVEKRVKDFLSDLKQKHAGKCVAVVSHRAPQLALDVLLKGRSWKAAIKKDWRLKKPKEWKPGWGYVL
ncbi:histidine phosphatase family protein [Candidatus Woesearchaeota archaeon]|nr:histidine phosphatase family protein [Candidatus Woesearchaeota archaeon]